MEPEDLIAPFIDYLAITMQVNDLGEEESDLEAFEKQKANFLRCPCCPAGSDTS